MLIGSSGASWVLFPPFVFPVTDSAVLFSLVRVKIVKEKALPEIENYMFEEHDQIRQAAVELMCNMCTCKEVRLEEDNLITYF